MEQFPGRTENAREGEGAHYDEAALAAELKSAGRTFLEFQSNFYGRLPGGLDRKMLEQLKSVGPAEGDAEAAIIEAKEKQYRDMDAILAELSPAPELVARAADQDKNGASEPTALLRQLYIRMRQRGYSHAELTS